MNPNDIDGRMFDQVRVQIVYTPQQRTVAYAFSDIPAPLAGEFFEWIGSAEEGKNLLINATLAHLRDTGRISQATYDAEWVDVP